jgi:AcrR family transcriptional regulator
MPSISSKFRHDPKQERSEQTIERVLEAAASVMAEVGYEAATMTAIAARAGSSIGTVYQYFPKKDSVVSVLRKRFGEAMEARLIELAAVAATLSIDQIADRFIQQTKEFVDLHPAYFHVMDAAVKAKRSQEGRERLRAQIVKVLRIALPSVADDELARMANIIPALCKSMSTVYAETEPRARENVIRDYTHIMSAYLSSPRLHGRK